VVVQGADELPGSELGSAGGVQDAAGDLTAAGDGAMRASTARRDFIRSLME